MAKPEWGTKRSCHNCGSRFYDLQRDPIICPVCGTVFDPDRSPRTRRTGGARADAAVAGGLPGVDLGERIRVAALADQDLPDTDIEDIEEAETEKDTDLDEIEAEEDDLIEDTSDLGEDDDDIGEVIEHIDEDIEDKP